MMTLCSRAAHSRPDEGGDDRNADGGADARAVPLKIQPHPASIAEREGALHGDRERDGAIGGGCLLFTRDRLAISAAAGRRLGSAEFPIWRRRGFRSVAAPLHDDRRGVRRSRRPPARDRRLRREFPQPRLRGRIVRSGTAVGREPIFHNSAGRARGREILQALGWPARSIPPIRLRRHGPARNTGC